MKKALLTYGRKKGLYQSKVTSSLTSSQRQGHQAQNCKMDYLRRGGGGSNFTQRLENQPPPNCDVKMIVPLHYFFLFKSCKDVIKTCPTKMKGFFNLLHGSTHA